MGAKKHQFVLALSPRESGSHNPRNPLVAEMKHLAGCEAQLEDAGFQPTHCRATLLDDARDLGHDEGPRGLVVGRLSPLSRFIKAKI
jgi:hypothetical protein